MQKTQEHPKWVSVLDLEMKKKIKGIIDTTPCKSTYQSRNTTIKEKTLQVPVKMYIKQIYGTFTVNIYM